MKILLFTLLIFFIGFTSCSLNINKKPSGNNDPIGGVEPPMSNMPFKKIDLEKARSIAFEKVKKGNGMVSYRKLVILIVDENADIMQTVTDLGFTNKDMKNWKKNYLAIVLHSNESDAQKLINQYNIQGFPVTIKESNAVDGTEVFSNINYGVLPWVTGENKVDVRKVVTKMHERYQAGDKDRQLLLQLRNHLTLLEKSPEASDALYLNITNDYLNQFSRTERSTYKGFRVLRREVKDVRYDMIKELINNRKYYNETFLKIANDKKLKNKVDADWMIKQAIIRSLEIAAGSGDISLFETVMAVRGSFDPEYNSEAAAKAVLVFHIRRDESEKVRFAALEYFSIRHNWHSVNSFLLETGASAVNQHSDQKSEWEQAAKWMDRVVSKNPNPTSYRLQLELLNKIGDNAKAKEVLQKIKTYQEDFIAFKNHYSKRPRPITLVESDITKKEYQKVNSIPSKYETYYRYIARESSLYKKGEAIEPIALLTENANEVSLLTRVHLVTGSLLPVTHYRSYYIQSRFSLEGAHLGSVYVTGKEI